MEKSKRTDYSWGTEIIWANQKEYSGRVLIIKEGDAIPFGYYKHQNKTFFVLQGVVQLRLEGQTKMLQEGDVYSIPSRVIYQFIAIKGDATILECGTKLSDDFVGVKL